MFINSQVYSKKLIVAVVGILLCYGRKFQLKSWQLTIINIGQTLNLLEYIGVSPGASEEEISSGSGNTMQSF